jgi:hypothetical protein
MLAVDAQHPLQMNCGFESAVLLSERDRPSHRSCHCAGGAHPLPCHHHPRVCHTGAKPGDVEAVIKAILLTPEAQVCGVCVCVCVCVCITVV